MRYVGGKSRLSKYILPIILENRKVNQWYVEPFAGGMSVIENVMGNRIANDIDEYLIELYKALQKGWVPPDIITKDEYRHIKDNKELWTKELVAFVGYGCSFGAKWFGGYAQGGFNGNNTKKCSPRIHSLESKRNLLKQINKMRDVIFTNNSYQDLEIPKESIIYCDPPYQNTLGYKQSFDHEMFYKWCTFKQSEGHRVFISEFYMPEDKFKCVWSKEKKITINMDNYKTKIERLYIPL